jgi:hypothetical protein
MDDFLSYFRKNYSTLNESEKEELYEYIKNADPSFMKYLYEFLMLNMNKYSYRTAKDRILEHITTREGSFSDDIKYIKNPPFKRDLLNRLPQNDVERIIYCKNNLKNYKISIDTDKQDWIKIEDHFNLDERINGQIIANKSLMQHLDNLRELIKNNKLCLPRKKQKSKPSDSISIDIKFDFDYSELQSSETFAAISNFLYYFEKLLTVIVQKEDPSSSIQLQLNSIEMGSINIKTFLRVVTDPLVKHVKPAQNWGDYIHIYLYDIAEKLNKYSKTGEPTEEGYSVNNKEIDFAKQALSKIKKPAKITINIENSPTLDITI